MIAENDQPDNDDNDNHIDVIVVTGMKAELREQY